SASSRTGDPPLRSTDHRPHRGATGTSCRAWRSCASSWWPRSCCSARSGRSSTCCGSSPWPSWRAPNGRCSSCGRPPSCSTSSRSTARCSRSRPRTAAASPSGCSSPRPPRAGSPSRPCARWWSSKSSILVSTRCEAFGRGPLEQCRLSLLARQRTPLQPQLLEVLPRLADLRPRLQPEQFHDRVAVEVGADGAQVLLGADPRDPLLERVVVALEPLGLAPVAGRAVRAHQLVQALQLRAGVGDVAAHRRISPPLALLVRTVAVEPQVQ